MNDKSTTNALATPAGEPQPVPNCSAGGSPKRTSLDFPTASPLVNGQCNRSRLLPVRHRRPEAWPARLTVVAQVQPPRRPALPVVARPVLAGDPNMLRVLRAAEMASWEAIAPATRTTEPLTRSTKSAYLGAPAKRAFDGEALLWFLLAGSALVGVMVGIYDVTQLLNGWSHFVQGIRTLLA